MGKGSVECRPIKGACQRTYSINIRYVREKGLDFGHTDALLIEHSSYDVFSARYRLEGQLRPIRKGGTGQLHYIALLADAHTCGNFDILIICGMI
jgi:hypothetical protein